MKFRGHSKTKGWIAVYFWYETPMEWICSVDWLLTSRVTAAAADLTVGYYSQQDIVRIWHTVITSTLSRSLIKSNTAPSAKWLNNANIIMNICTQDLRPPNRYRHGPLISQMSSIRGYWTTKLSISICLFNMRLHACHFANVLIQSGSFSVNR